MVCRRMPYSTSHESCTELAICFVLLWLGTDRFYPYPVGLMHWQWCNYTIDQEPGKQLQNGETLRWRHNWHGSVSNHQHHHCLLNRLVRRRSKKTSKLRVTGLCAGNSPATGEFPTQMASNVENVSISWCHHGNNTNKKMLYNRNQTKHNKIVYMEYAVLKILRPRQNCHHFTDDSLKCIIFNDNLWLSNNISLN